MTTTPQAHHRTAPGFLTQKGEQTHCRGPHGGVRMSATSCVDVRKSGKLRAGAEHTQDSASGRHVSAALSCPYSVRFRGWDRLSARTAAQRNLCVHPHPHPYALNTLQGGHQKLIPEPKTMTTPKAGTPGVAASVGRYIPRHYLRRLAYSLASKATRRAELRARAFAVVLADHREGGV